MRTLILLVCVLAAAAVISAKRPSSTTESVTSGKSHRSSTKGPTKPSQTPSPRHPAKEQTIKEASAGKTHGPPSGKQVKGGKSPKTGFKGGAPKAQKSFQGGKPPKVKDVAKEEKSTGGMEKEPETKKELIGSVDLDKNTPDQEEEEKKQEKELAVPEETGLTYNESLISDETAAELASLRAELAAAKEAAGLRTAVAEQLRLKEKADKAARKAAALPPNRPPKAKKCLDIDFTGQEEAGETTGTVGLQRCSCSCRPAVLPAKTTAADPAAPSDLSAPTQAALTSEEDSAAEPSLDQI